MNVVSNWKRIEYIDVCKGIGILIMILGHIGFGSIFDQLIHAFHMPLFFVISGYLYRQRKIKIFDFIKIKAKSLLMPYILVGLLHYVIWVLIYHGRAEDILKPLRNLLWVNTNSAMPIAGALWFLTCLFFVEVLFYCLQKVIRNETFFCCCILFITVLGILFPNVILIRLPWAIDVALVANGFYYFGYLLRKYEDIKSVQRIMSLKPIMIVLGVLLFTVLVLVNSDVNMRTGKYAFFPLTLLNAVALSLIFLNISKCMRRGRSWETLSYIGCNSITYLCFNQFMILVLKKIASIVTPYPDGKMWLVAGGGGNFFCLCAYFDVDKCNYYEYKIKMHFWKIIGEV